MEQAPTFRAVVFDLGDTIGDLTLVLNRTLADLGLPPHAEAWCEAWSVRDCLRALHQQA